MGKLLKLKDDIVFQELFGKQKNSKITAHLISLILGKEVKDINLDTNKRMLGDSKNSKTCRLDIRAKFNDGMDCNIELQVEPFQFMNKRLLKYWADNYGRKINRSEVYNVLKPTIIILIADYKLVQTQNNPNYHSVFNLREKNHHEIIFSEDIEIHVLEIPKLKKSDVENDELARWLKFIDNPENKEVKKIMEENEYYKQAEEELEYLSGDPNFKNWVMDRAFYLMDQASYAKQLKDEGIKEGLEKGIKEGIEEGIKNGEASGKKKSQIEIAKKLLKLNMPIEQISKITELSIEEIEKLKD